MEFNGKQIQVSGLMSIIRYITGLSIEETNISEDKKMILKGIHHFVEQNYDLAIICFEQALSINPENYYAVHNLAVLTKNNEEAEKYREQARSIDPVFDQEYRDKLGDNFHMVLITSVSHEVKING